MEQFSDLKEKTLKYIQATEDELYMETYEGEKYKLHHEQDCCENVSIESIEGDFNDLLDSPITLAEESTSEDKFHNKPENGDSWLWTFYRLATVKGYVNIRWLGESNGYYSERVTFTKLN